MRIAQSRSCSFVRFLGWRARLPTRDALTLSVELICFTGILLFARTSVHCVRYT